MRKANLAAKAALILCTLTFTALAAPGDVITEWPAPSGRSLGMAFDGEAIWTVDRLTDMLYRTDPASGELLDSIPTPGYTPLGLAWDGHRLWVVDSEEQLIYAIHPADRVVEKTIWCPVTRPGGLAWDGDYLWIADDGDNKLQAISPEDGTTILTIPAPTGHPCGLAYDGEYLWVSDRYDDEIYMVTRDRGDVILTLRSPAPHPWGLAWDGTHVWNVDYESDRIYKLVVDDETPFTRYDGRTETVEFIHEARNFGPDSLLTLDVFLAIPQNRDTQELLDSVTFDPAPHIVTEDKWGQKIAVWEFRDVGPGDFTDVRMSVPVTAYKTRYFVFPDKVGGLNQIPKDITDLYLADDTKYSMDDPVIGKALKEAVGDEDNPYWIGRKIYNYVIDHMEYQLAGGWNIAPTVLERGNGSCSEYSFVYISMCRAAGLPARFAGSVVVRGDNASFDEVFHRWVEIYLPGYGWIPVDPSGGDSPWPARRADYFGFLNNRFLITTVGGGGSEYLEWSYNANERWTSRGRCKVVVENFAEWSPIPEEGTEE